MDSMEYSKIVHLIDTDPVVQALFELPMPMHLAYVGLDGHPRAVPILPLWKGKAFVFASPTKAYKVKAIAANPQVGFTLDVGPGRMAAEARVKVSAVLGLPVVDYAPLIMMGRGTASVEIKPGVPQEHIDASRLTVGDEKKLEELARIKREQHSDMALISIIPTYVTVIDFITRFPPPAEVNSQGFTPAEVYA
jgi:hypothetical protein